MLEAVLVQLVLLQDYHPWTKTMCAPPCQSCETGCMEMQACMVYQQEV